MSVQYDVYYRDDKIGTLKMEKENLYYRIQCSCNIPGNDIYRLVAIGGKDAKDLGICVPDNQKLVLTKYVPVKEFFPENVRFLLRKHSKEEPEQIIPVHQNQSFLQIRLLHKAKWKCCGDITGIIIEN